MSTFALVNSKNVALHMKFILFASISFLLISCAQSTQKKTTNTPFIPSSAQVIFKINNLKKLNANITNNTLYQNNKNHLISNHFRAIDPLSVLETNDKAIYVCYSPIGKNELGTTVITTTGNIKLNTEELSKKITGNYTYNKHNYSKITVKNTSFYATKLDSIWVATDHKLLLENSIREFQNPTTKDTQLEESLLALDKSKSFSALIKNSQISELSNRLLPNFKTNSLRNLTGWSALDFTVDANTISFNGIYKPKDTANDYTSIFNKTIAQTNEVLKITPINAKSVTSFTYDNFEQVWQNLSVYNSRELNFETDILDDFIGETNEFGVIELENEKLIAFTLLNDELDVENYFSSDGVFETYRDTPIFKLSETLNLEEKLTPLILAKNLNYYIQTEAFIVFAESNKGLKTLISALKNEDTLTESEWFEDFSEEISNESSVLFIQNIDELNTIVTNGVADTYTKDWKKTNTKGYRLSALQLNADTNFTHLHYVVSKTKPAKIEGKVNQMASTFLDSEIINTPHFVKNYVTKGMDAVVQDKKNQLSLLSNTGKIIWQKSIDAPILGKIEQIDMYRNGRLQLVFTTQNALHVVDRKGNDVAPFPIKFNDPITQPVAVFDYDKNRKYRIAVVQNSKLSLYDQRGKLVSGFNFKNENNGSITQLPKHIRVGSKDYILVNENTDGLHILSRTGKERIKIKPKATVVSNNNWYWYKNAFTSVTTDNLVTQVNINGEVNKIKPTKQGEDISIDATTKTLATLVENTLTIKGKKVNLDYGLYTAPKIFYINNKIFVSVTDTQTSKIYLFDSNAKPISGFPIYGNSLIDMANIDKDNAIELVAKGDKNSVLIYEFR